MKHIALSGLALSFLFGSCSSEAASRQDGLMKATVGLMNQIADQLGTVHDEASAMAAEKSLEPILAELGKVAEAGQKLGEPSAELRAKYESQMEAVQQRMMSIMQKTMTNPAVAQHMMPLMEKMQAALPESRK